MASQGEGPKTLGGAVKPKFVPKVPVKKTPAISEPEDNRQNKEKKEHSKTYKDRERTERHPGRGSGRGGGGRESLDGRGGRGRFSLPTGVAFFTGNKSSQISSASQYTFESSPSVGKPQSEGNSLGVKSEVDFSQGRLTPSPTLGSGEDGEEEGEGGDSDYSSMDEEDLKRGKSKKDSKSEKEMWPPEYDPLSPQTLPFGPRSKPIRDLRNNEPLFASLSDPQALSDEESAALLLLQMPSDLKRYVPSTSSSSSSSNQSGKIGKIQVTRSGRAFLRTESGQTFELSPGIPSSFVQYVCSLSLHSPPSPATSSSSSTPSTTSTTSTSTPSSSSSPPVPAPTSGSLHFLGGVTRKLVLTPTHPIGKEREWEGTGKGKEIVQDRAREGVEEEDRYIEGEERMRDIKPSTSSSSSSLASLSSLPPSKASSSSRPPLFKPSLKPHPPPTKTSKEQQNKNKPKEEEGEREWEGEGEETEGIPDQNQFEYEREGTGREDDLDDGEDF